LTVEQTLRVTSVRSQNPRGFGGCIFSAKLIDDHGRVLDATGYFVVKATASTLGGSRVEPGQWWKVAGELSKRVLEVNGFQVAETQIDASSAVLLRPSGEHIIAFMADSPAFEGIGHVKARKLWEAFGERLYEQLDAGNVAELATVLHRRVRRRSWRPGRSSATVARCSGYKPRASIGRSDARSCSSSALTRPRSLRRTRTGC
jgi:exodeoxyribonuclease V alpha subunit